MEGSGAVSQDALYIKQEPEWDSEDEAPLKPHAQVKLLPQQIKVEIEYEPGPVCAKQKPLDSAGSCGESKAVCTNHEVKDGLMGPESIQKPIVTHALSASTEAVAVERKVTWKRRTQQGDGKKSYPCDICGKQFNRGNDLARHIRVHTGEKPYACEICEKRFKDSGALFRHKTVHTGNKIKRFTCDICKRQFACLDHLTTHIRTHTGEKPFSCEVCQRRFVRAYHLVKHNRIHTGERPYSCEICNKQFKGSGELVRHRRIHTGEKPYCCEICNKSFKQSKSLTNHRKNHTGEEIIKRF